ncbi:C-type lectin domain family 4 member K-like [Podarcis raffonei]|uniref:C-type lectin domain family 4 member K-like n=1 Tax=Podarcis raffonei TaxID=65483 RepID=UPI0023298AAA|nr:C-type lectin domain family 4 member K-like [Podarcis raffonei]
MAEAATAKTKGNVKPAATAKQPKRFSRVKKLFQRNKSVPKAAPGKKPTFKERLVGAKAILYSPYALYAAMMVLVGCIVVSSIMIVLYNREMKKRTIFLKGVNEISDYMGRKYPDLQSLEDVDRINIATNLSLRLTEENKKNKELQVAIDDILGRLEQHWTVYNKRLYLFDIFKPPRTWQDCADYCVGKPFSGMINVESRDEELYLESQLKGSTSDFWIGMYKRGHAWSWIDATHRFDEKYWMSGQPDNKGFARPGTENCVGLIKNCATRLKCWHDAPCSSKKKCICKMLPQQKWLT